MNTYGFDVPAAGLAIERTSRCLAAGLGNGRIALFDLSEQEPGQPRFVDAHEGAVLQIVARSGDFVSGGDDGRVVVTRERGAISQFGAFGQSGGWIDALAATADGAQVAVGVGKTVRLCAGDGRTAREWPALPSTVAALAFSPDGRLLAAAHYGGVTLLPAGTTDEPRRLEWRGSHIGVTWSPDGAHVVASAQEPEVHAWRLADGAAMQMGGYGTKVRSLSWGRQGKYLATSGSDGLVLWPFIGGGPFGAKPIEVAPPRGVLASAVACHPATSLFAIGYRDGAVHLTRFDDAAPTELLPPDGEPVSQLAWSPNGRWLASAGEGGRVGILRHRESGFLRRLARAFAAARSV